MALKGSYFNISQAESNGGNLFASFLVFQPLYMPIGPTNNQASFITVQRAEYQVRKPQFETGFYMTQYAQVAPEDDVTDLVFPQLIGLSWDTEMKPVFSTKIADHTSGKETRTSFWADPKWDFKLTYDYLPNKSAGVTDLKRMIGFFLTCSGAFEEFLFKAPDFYRVENLDLLTGDGDTVEVLAVQELDGFLMPVGQLNPETCILYLELTNEDHTLDSGASMTLTYPWQATISHVQQGSDVYTQVASAPGVHEYTFNPVTGVLQFSAAHNNQSGFKISYKGTLRLGDEFSILSPRTFVLETAPPEGSILSGTYEYYFVCRFLDDEADFAQFSTKLWNLQEINFRSIIQ